MKLRDRRLLALATGFVVSVAGGYVAGLLRQPRRPHEHRPHEHQQHEGSGG